MCPYLEEVKEDKDVSRIYIIIQSFFMGNLKFQNSSIFFFFFIPSKLFKTSIVNAKTSTLIEMASIEEQ